MPCGAAAGCTLKRILVTGANGFVGSELHCELVRRGYSVRGAARTAHPGRNPGSCMNEDGEDSREFAVINDIGPETDWTECLQDVDAVVHLAARVHLMNDKANDPLAEFRRVNTAGTERLAHMAAIMGVRRFVYVSSIKVNGEKTGEAPFTEADEPAPEDPYALSKWEAEQALWRISREAGMEVVIVRPPLVYGPGVKANFLRLMDWVNKGIPLPLAGVKNKRSLVARDNLVHFLVRCLEHPAAAGETFLISDGEDLSTPELIRAIADQMGRPAWLVRIPPRLLCAGAAAFGKQGMVDRLCGSLQVDIGKARQMLEWSPPVSVCSALKRTVEWYLGGR